MLRLTTYIFLYDLYGSKTVVKGKIIGVRLFYSAAQHYRLQKAYFMLRFFYSSRSQLYFK